MHQYREVLYRIRQGQSTRAIERAKLMGRSKAQRLINIAQPLGWLDPAVELPDNATGASVTINTPWGTEQVCRYRVGIPSRSLAKHREDAKKEQTAEAIFASHEKLKKQIVYAVINANNQGEQINREMLKHRIAGKSQTIVAIINELINDGYLKQIKTEGKRGFNLEALKGKRSINPSVACSNHL